MLYHQQQGFVLCNISFESHRWWKCNCCRQRVFRFKKCFKRCVIIDAKVPGIIVMLREVLVDIQISDVCCPCENRVKRCQSVPQGRTVVQHSSAKVRRELLGENGALSHVSRCALSGDEHECRAATSPSTQDLILIQGSRWQGTGQAVNRRPSKEPG